ncbi:nucleotidyltransferase [Enterococcus casseliflavus]|uniref:nucleotidyltransferase domain-containing protein n=1 Tax=Enterococcus casseliflavus TaxID=37734 RepID=UPI0011A77317|nr:nucleotidyltransferase [Enterococcus casseliflavus]
MINETLSKIFHHISESLNISRTDNEEIVNSYKAVGSYLGELEEELNISIFPQGSLSLGTIIKPLATDRNGEYDVDLVCRITNGQNLTPKEVKNIIGNRLKQSKLYSEKLDSEGKRCWTLNYYKYHMDILPCIPYSTSEFDTKIVLTEKIDSGEYVFGLSNPKGFRNWFTNEMLDIFNESREAFSKRNNVDIEEVKLYQVRTPLQKVIQILKRHRDIAFEGEKYRPSSIIITTLAAKAYNGEQDLFTALSNIIYNMEKYIEIDQYGNYNVYNPVDSTENFTDRWRDNPERKDAFFSWLLKAKSDIVDDPVNFIEGLDSLKERLSRNFGQDLVNTSFESYGESISKIKNNNGLGLNENDFLSTDSNNKKKPIANHTFYGGE